MGGAHSGNLIDREIDAAYVGGHAGTGNQATWVRQAGYLDVQQIPRVSRSGRVHRLVEDGADGVDLRRRRIYRDADCQASLPIRVDSQCILAGYGIGRNLKS